MLELSARVIQVRDIDKGAAVGYGSTFIANKPMRVATIAVGYADGWFRALSNKGSAFYGDTRLPIVGRVSMDRSRSMSQHCRKAHSSSAVWSNSLARISGSKMWRVIATLFLMKS